MNTTKDVIEVSVICNAYNHERYIRSALEGFVMQKTDFTFEVLVHDDASTDGTAAIIREYEEKYPEIIKPIYETENQYSKKDGSLIRIQYGRVKGRYVAFCEGDDYWTDPLKLQKQYDAMEAHPEVDICAHAVNRVNADTQKLIAKISPQDRDTIIPVEEVIMGDGGYVGTNSLFLRSSILNDMPLFRKKLYMDYTLQINGALRGGMLYLKDTMSVYRYLTHGSWTERMSHDPERRSAFILKKQEMLRILDEETDHRYSAVIEKRSIKNEFILLRSQEKYREAMGKKYREFYNELPLKSKIKLRIAGTFPWLLRVKHKFAK